MSLILIFFKPERTIKPKKDIESEMMKITKRQLLYGIIASAIFSIPAYSQNKDTVSQKTNNEAFYDSILTELNANTIKDSVQQELDKKILEIAIKNGFLKKGSTIDDLTINIKVEMCDYYVLNDAKNLGYLNKTATLSDLTADVRKKMKQNNDLKTYYPDGEESYQLQKK